VAVTPAHPSARSHLAAELEALERALGLGRGETGDDRLEAACVAVRAARDIVGGAGEPLDRDVAALLRVAAACTGGDAAHAPDPDDVVAALTLIAKRVTAAGGAHPSGSSRSADGAAPRPA
jgi:hypothetical protein